MLNIMIALLSSAFAKVTQDEGLRFLVSKAESIDELETTLPRWLRPASWYPPFVGVLKFGPGARGFEVSLDKMWSGIGSMESNLLNAQGETRLRVESIEERLQRLDKKLDVLVKLTLGCTHAQAAQQQAASASAAAGLVGLARAAAGPSRPGRSRRRRP